MDPTRWHEALVILAALLVLAAISARNPAYRNPSRLRRIAAVAGGYALAVAVATLLPAAEWSAATTVASDVAFILGWWTVIELVALAVLRMLLPALGSGLPSIVCDLLFGAAVMVLIVAGMRRFGVEPTSIVATSAVVTGILALSLQTTLGNVIGGVALQIDRSVRVGDWVQLENGRQGLVREIHWRHTVMETRDWDTIIVPNSYLLGANIIILGKRVGQPLQHRMWVYFNVDFRFAPARVIHTVEEAVARGAPIPGVSTTPPPNCVIMDFSNDQRDSYARYAVRYWLTDLPADDPASSRVRERIYSSLARAGIPLAIPARQVFLEDSTARRRRNHEQEMVKRLSGLRGVEFLQMLLTDEELERLAEGLQPAPFVAGEIITRQNAVGNWLYVLAEGSADVDVAQGAQRRHVARLDAPSFFGEMSLMTGEPRRATVTAASAVLCYRLHRDVFKQVLEQRPAIVAEISKVLAERQVGLQSARDDLDHRSKQARVDAESQRLLARISDFFGLA